MSVEVLREAARLMRERAGAATQGPWSDEAIGSEGHRVYAPEGSRKPLKGRAIVASCNWQDWEEAGADAEHVASWHPAVALAVANWLDIEADVIDIITATDREYRVRGSDEALALARAYLGSDQ